VGALAWASLLGACSSPSDLPRDEALERRLGRAGYTVQRGRVTGFTVEDCGALSSCFGNNATTPYGMWWLPPSPGQSSPQPGALSLPPDDQGRTAAWTLRSDEAVVYVGRTSPEAAYYSFAPYLFSRVNSDGERVPVFASLGDAVNMTHFPDAPFGREIGVIVTANVELEAELRRDLRATGLPDGDIVTFGLAAEQLQLGLGPDDDTIMMLQRFALFDDPAEGAAYLDDIPATVLRVTPREPRAGASFPIATRAARATGDSELVLSTSLDTLEQAVRAEHASATVTDVRILSANALSLLLRSEGCIANDGNCLGEISDTVYSAGPISASGGGGPADTLFLGAAPGERLVAMGVNHAAFGRATYSNVVVMNSGRLMGVAAMTHDAMRGSADAYLPDDPDADYLFAVTIARDCGDEAYCLEVPTEFPGVALDEALSLAFRAYVQPGSSVSPAPRELLVERVVHVLP
jgi:hypothetical protein